MGNGHSTPEAVFKELIADSQGCAAPLRLGRSGLCGPVGHVGPGAAGASPHRVGDYQADQVRRGSCGEPETVDYREDPRVAQPLPPLGTDY
jgi:hypothetical protein